MVGLVFLYKHFLKRNFVWIDITVFAIVVALAQVIFVDLFLRLDAGVWTVVGSVVFLAGLLTAFLRFTLRPPPEPDVFIDPITGRYGIDGHPDATP